MKKEYLFLIVAIVGLSALLFYQKQGKTNYQLPQLEKISGSADHLVLEKGKEHVELRRVDGNWVIEPQGWRANQERVETMVAELKKLKLGALVSEKKNYQLYELTPEKRLTVALYQGDKLLRKIAIGKCSSTFRQTYIMLGDDPMVYQALGNLKNNFFIKMTDLRDKTVMKISDEELRKIDALLLERWENGQRKFLEMLKAAPGQGDEKSARTKENGAGKEQAAEKVWRLAGGKPAVVGAVQGLLKLLSHLQCQNFVDSPGPEAFAKPAFRVVARGGGKEFTLSLLKAKEGACPGRSSCVKETFRLPKWRADKIIQDFSVYTGEKKKVPARKGEKPAGHKRKPKIGKSG